MAAQKKLFAVGAVLLIALAAAYFFISAKPTEIPEEYPELSEGIPLAEFLTEETPDDVAEIEMTTQGVSYKRESGKWIFSGDGRIKINQPLLNGLSENFSNLQKNVAIENATDAHKTEFGLGSPTLGAVRYSDGTEYLFKVGAESPTGSGVYFMLNGDPNIYLDTSGAARHLLYRVEAFMDVAVDWPDANALTEISYNGVKIAKEDNKLNLIEPLRRGVTETKLQDALIDKLKKFMFLNVLISMDYNDGFDYGFDDPKFSFYVKDPDKTLSVTIGKEYENTGTFYAKYNDETQVYIAAHPDINELINLPLSEYANRELARPASANVEKAEVNGAEIDFEALYTKLNLSLDVIGVYELVGEPIVVINYDLKEGEDVELLFYEHNNNFYAVQENGASVGLIGTKYLEPILAPAE